MKQEFLIPSEWLTDISDAISEVLRQKDHAIIAIDGRCGAGKTTLAAAIAAINTDCGCIHMDDFYLRPEQRVPERYLEPGGNVDRERFRDEVMRPLLTGRAFYYRPLVCPAFRLGEPIYMPVKKLTVIEGSYSCHPELADGYDLRIFLDISSDEQMRRIRKRNGEERALDFKRRWIPLEELYFSTFSIAESCHLYFASN